MATIHVDGRPYQVDERHNLLQACLSLGLDLPYFCWHPALGSVGACRQCAVIQYRDADDDRGSLVMACMTPAAEGTRIAVEAPEARDFRRGIIEWLMVNHPHDCPVCEEGGHCHLQDMTVMTGHARRHYRFTKRTHRNQYLGPFLGHEMNRCISCYRCVRFYRDHAGGEDLGVFGANDNLYFGRHREGVLESPFAGNLSEVCPTGVFTDRPPGGRYTRRWDLQFAPSVCHQCAVGCNISPGERYGELRRVENRYHGEINRYFLCDRGRYGYGYVNRADRPRLPEWREARGEAAMTLGVDAALDRGADRLRGARRVIGVGSPRASLESNHRLRELVGAEHFCLGVTRAAADGLATMARLQRQSGLPSPSLRDIEAHDAVLVLGEDPLNSAARLGLALRQAVLGRREELAAARGVPAWNAQAVQTLAQDRRHPLFVAYPAATGLDGLAEATWRLAPADIARLGAAVAHALDPAAPEVAGLEEGLAEAAATIAGALGAAERPLVVSGDALASTAVLEAAGSVARALARRAKPGGLSLIRAEANATGVALLGGRPLEWVLEEIEAGRADALVVLENDLHARLPHARLDRALARLTSLVVLDHQRTATWARADLGLPAASFAEGDGTLVSLEGRAQRFFQVFEPSFLRPETRIRESWRWLHALQGAIQRRRPRDTRLDAETRDCARHHPALAAITEVAAPADHRVQGLRLARAPHRYSGRTALRAHLGVAEPRPPEDPDSPFAFSMEGYAGRRWPRRDIAFAWAPGWNSPQAWNKFTDEVGGHLRAGDPGVRLLAPVPGAYAYAPVLLSPFVRRDGEWLVVVLPRLFGGEETSRRSPLIAERASAPVLALAPEDVEEMGLAEGATLELVASTGRVSLPLSCRAGLARGLVGVPAGVAPGLATGQWGRLRPVTPRRTP
ncbi:NADH-quinone oxidoreductase subunit NuoG [Halomonas organivorans]